MSKCLCIYLYMQNLPPPLNWSAWKHQTIQVMTHSHTQVVFFYRCPTNVFSAFFISRISFLCLWTFCERQTFFFFLSLARMELATIKCIPLNKTASCIFSFSSFSSLLRRLLRNFIKKKRDLGWIVICIGNRIFGVFKGFNISKVAHKT